MPSLAARLLTLPKPGYFGGGNEMKYFQRN